MKIASNKIADITRYFRQELKDIYSSEEIETFIAWTFEDFLNIKRHQINGKQQETVTESELLKFSFAVKDLKKHKPIQHILGKADFYGMKFIVNPHVLIPRPETEQLVDLIIKDRQKSPIPNPEPDIMDFGTGSGCIPITLKKHIPKAFVSSMDISKEAIKVAKANAELNEVIIGFFHDDILKPQWLFRRRYFDIIVSNPPYITNSEKAQMQKNVLDYEPHLALFVEDKNPIVFYEAISNFAVRHLKVGGKLYFEINPIYSEELKRMMQTKGFKNVELIKDINNNNRILRGEI